MADKTEWFEKIIKVMAVHYDERSDSFDTTGIISVKKSNSLGQALCVAVGLPISRKHMLIIRKFFMENENDMKNAVKQENTYVHHKMGSTEEKLNNLIEAIASIDKKIDLRMESLEKSLLAEFKNVRKELNAVSEKQKELTVEVDGIQIEVEALKQESLRNEVVITGVPNLTNNTNLLEVVNRIVESLGLTKIREIDVKKIFLLKKKRK